MADERRTEPIASTSALPPPPPPAKRPRFSSPGGPADGDDRSRAARGPVQFGALNTFAPLQNSFSTPKRPLQPLRELPKPLLPVAASASGATLVLPDPVRASHKKHRAATKPLDSPLARRPRLPSPKPDLKPLPSFSLFSHRSTPQKPLGVHRPPRVESPAKPATPISERASALFGALPLSSKRDGVRLMESIPSAPVLASGWDEQEAGEWSPRKKSAKYSLGGLASRTQSLLARTRTDQTLWLHSLARLLVPHQSPTSPTLSLSALAKISQPVVRLRVLNLLPLADSQWDLTPRALLVRCRLLLARSDDPADEESQDDGSTGLVLLSLHAHPPSSALPPRKRPTGGGASLFLPTTAVDFGLVRAGVEVWAWDPMYEVVRPAGLGTMLRARRSERGFDGAEGEVVFDPRPVEQIERERTERRTRDEHEERAERALVCARFAIVC